MSDVQVRDNATEGRFEAAVGDHVGISAYRIDGGTITFTGTQVPEALRGQGVGQALARAGLDAARARGLKVVPRCPFIAAYIRRHPEYAGLLVD